MRGDWQDAEVTTSSRSKVRKIVRCLVARPAAITHLFVIGACTDRHRWNRPLSWHCAAPWSRKIVDGVVGMLLLAAALLFLKWMIVEYQRPNSRGWTRSDLLAQAIVLFTISVLAFGIAYLVRFMITYKDLDHGVIEAILIAGIVLLTWLGLRGLRTRQMRLVTSATRAPDDRSGIVSVAPAASAEAPVPGQDPPRALSGGRRANKRKAA